MLAGICAAVFQQGWGLDFDWALVLFLAAVFGIIVLLHDQIWAKLQLYYREPHIRLQSSSLLTVTQGTQVLGL